MSRNECSAAADSEALLPEGHLQREAVIEIDTRGNPFETVNGADFVAGTDRFVVINAAVGSQVKVPVF